MGCARNRANVSLSKWTCGGALPSQASKTNLKTMVQYNENEALLQGAAPSQENKNQLVINAWRDSILSQIRAFEESTGQKLGGQKESVSRGFLEALRDAIKEDILNNLKYSAAGITGELEQEARVSYETSESGWSVEVTAEVELDSDEVTNSISDFIRGTFEGDIDVEAIAQNLGKEVTNE